MPPIVIACKPDKRGKRQEAIRSQPPAGGMIFTVGIARTSRARRSPPA